MRVLLHWYDLIQGSMRKRKKNLPRILEKRRCDTTTVATTAVVGALPWWMSVYATDKTR